MGKTKPPEPPEVVEDTETVSPDTAPDTEPVDDDDAPAIGAIPDEPAPIPVEPVPVQETQPVPTEVAPLSEDAPSEPVPEAAPIWEGQSDVAQVSPPEEPAQEDAPE